MLNEPKEVAVLQRCCHALFQAVIFVCI